ncbi:sensor histidine kinase [Cellulomonas sp. SLBN-39]|uniref:sensor histidine kinase n=1 Tax=Cellulomonas sp. SLBN-39 TaxID=2768446 RepID=UPI0011747AB1|nr:ATP-binding protein [Cellulomonas sp. SLBN-39]TQL01662.1 signal transduction histidine kinase [Cellulomonas sp. SLBN-39]
MDVHAEDPVEARGRARDDAGDRRAMLGAAALLASVYAIGAVLQSAYVYANLVPGWQGVPVVSRLLANFVAIGALLVTLGALQVQRWRGPWAITGGIVAGAVVLSAVRLACQVALGVYTEPDRSTVDAEVAAGLVIGSVSAGAGVWAAAARRTLRAQARAAERETRLVQDALRALENEEVRLRRAVAEGLHASLQQRLVLLTGRIDRLADRLEATGTVAAGDVPELRAVRGEVETVRAQDVREMSRLLFPEQLEIGVVPAIRAIVRRLPPIIAVRVGASPALRAADDPADPRLTMAERLLAVRVVEEALTNALKHAAPTRLEVDLDLDGVDLVVRVRDDGGGFDPAAVTPSGTTRLRERVHLVGGTLAVVTAPGDGTTVEARLPVEALRRA